MSEQDMPPPAELTALRTLQSSIEARLATATSDEDRAALKADIIALFRQADAGLRTYDALRTAARAFAEQWKARGPAQQAPLRVDHLGASTYIEKGWTLLSSEAFADAERALRRALELAPDHQEAIVLLAWSLAHQGMLDDAEARLAGVLSRNGDAPLALTIGGFVALQRGSNQQAMEQLHRAIAGASHDRRALLYAHLYLGMVFTALEMYDAAIEYLQRALTLGPNMLQAAFELGHTLWKCGRHEDARLAWRAGAQANKFSAWGKRCAEAIVQAETGAEPAQAR